MRELLLLVALGAVAYLAYDDYSNRKALREAQQQLQQQQEAQQNSATTAPSRVVRRPPTVFNPTPPAWFQERVRDGSSIDASRQHRTKDERDQPRP